MTLKEVLGLVVRCASDACVFPNETTPRLTTRAVCDWFRTFLPASDDEPQVYGFTSRRAIGEDQVGYVQGVFDLTTSTLTSGRFILADDEELALSQLHETSNVVFYR